MQTILRILIFVSLLSWFLNHATAAELEATVDRTKITEGDSLTLHLVAPTDSQDNPELGVLTTDFDILGQSQSTSMTIINGNSNSSREWDITIMPKRTGNITIPAITLGSLASEPISLQVLPLSQSDQANEPRPILVEVEVDTQTPYVQGQVIYKVRVLYRGKVQQMRLTDLKVADAIVEPLGEGADYTVERDGEKYKARERLYAIFPQHSGKLTIESPLLSAMVPDTSGRRVMLRDPFFQIPFGDPFGDMNSPFTQLVRARGQSIILEVKPQPAGTDTPWLPAEQVQLTETWDANPPKFRVSEPTTKTITVTVKGLSSAQIPDLEFALPSGIKAYSDKPQSQDQVGSNGLVATKIFKQALIADSAGKVTMPEISLSWWNTKTDKLEITSVPARTIDVLPAPQSQASDTKKSATSIVEQPQKPPTKQNADITQHTPATTGKIDQSAPISVNLPQDNQYTYWLWVAMAFGCAWLITLGLWFRDWYRRNRSSPKIALDVMTVKIGEAKAKVKQSCRANDAKTTRTALLAWGAARWPAEPPRHLDVLAVRLGPEVVKVVQELDRYLYSQQGTNSTWDGEAAWRVLAQAMGAESKHSAKTNRLPDLYEQIVAD